MGSVVHIVGAQKEKCDELRQQHHVLHDRLAYLCLLRDKLSRRQSNASGGRVEEPPAEPQPPPLPPPPPPPPPPPAPSDEATAAASAQLNEAVVAIITDMAVKLSAQVTPTDDSKNPSPISEFMSEMLESGRQMASGSARTGLEEDDDDDNDAQPADKSPTKPDIIDILNQLLSKVTALLEQVKNLSKNQQVSIDQNQLSSLDYKPIGLAPIETIPSRSLLLLLLLLLLLFLRLPRLLS